MLVALLLLVVLPDSAWAESSSLPEIKLAAEGGDAAAQEKLGDIFMARSDGAQAEVWYRKAAEAGRGTAQAKLGKRLLTRSRTGSGLDQAARDRLAKEALPWINMAARQGITAAQADLATLLLEGNLTSPDLVEAYKWGALAATAPAGKAERTIGMRVRDAAVLKMSVDEITEAERRVSAFQPQTPGQAGRSGAGLVDQLRLRGITGTPSNRLVLINSTTLAEGESAALKVANRTLVVECLEVTDASVIIRIEGVEGSRELRLGSPNR